MLVDPEVEEPTREMLGHAIRGELSELEAKIEAVGDETYAVGIALCMLAAGYIAVDLSGRWPTEADVREIARHDLWGYLDTVWSAVETAERAELSLLPALTLRSHRLQAAKKQ